MLWLLVGAEFIRAGFDYYVTITLLAESIYIGVAVFTALALLTIASNLGRYGCAAGFMVLTGLAATALTAAPHLLNLANLSPFIQIPIDYFTAAGLIGIISYGILTLLFLVLGLLSWRETQRVEYELATAIATRQNRISVLQGELKKISNELANVQQEMAKR